MTDKFAVIDTETNWNDEVMSIGIVIADTETMKKTDSKYYIIDPEYRVGGMFSSELKTAEKEAHITGRKQALKEISRWLDSCQVRNTCRNIQSMNGMISCVWRRIASTTQRYRSPRSAARPEG